MSETQRRIDALRTWRDSIAAMIDNARELEDVELAPGTPEHRLRLNLQAHVLPHAHECIVEANRELAELTRQRLAERAAEREEMAAHGAYLRALSDAESEASTRECLLGGCAYPEPA
jgi:hypothetical protein